MSFQDAISYQQSLLDQVLAEGVRQNAKQFETWNTYKKRHKKVIEALEILPKEVSVNCMVPVGKRALMKGKLCHTNEILVSLGDGYFAKYSALGAIALCNRRIQLADEMLEKFNKERNLLEMRQILPSQLNVFGEGDGKEIVEHWDEKRLEDWRAVHRQKEKEYHQKLASSKKQERTKIESEEDLFRRLDELELEEELADELHRMEDEYEEYYKEDVDDSEDDSHSEDEEESSTEESSTSNAINKNNISDKINGYTQSQDLNENNKNEKLRVLGDHDTQNETSKPAEERMQEANSKFSVISVQEKSVETSESKSPNDTSIKLKRRVSFAEPNIIDDNKKTKTSREEETPTNSGESSTDPTELESESEIIKIHFSHSNETPEIITGNGGEIESPYDIYRIFSMPKSILKKSQSDVNYCQAAPLSSTHSSDEDEEEDDEDVKPSAYKTIVKDIQERHVSDVTELLQTKNKRPVSKFKLERSMKI